MKTATLILGVVMIGLGAWLALQSLWMHGRPVTSSIALDLLCALFCLVRGTINVRRGMVRPAA